uniref:Uncharacterized protein n=1 Tax=Heterorhabditis bacteriophora TaxID=37862 RepID=A0A1I7XTL9_HETBA
MHIYIYTIFIYIHNIIVAIFIRNFQTSVAHLELIDDDNSLVIRAKRSGGSETIGEVNKESNGAPHETVVEASGERKEDGSGEKSEGSGVNIEEASGDAPTDESSGSQPVSPIVQKAASEEVPLTKDGKKSNEEFVTV